MKRRANVFIDRANFYFMQKNILKQKIDIVKLIRYFGRLYDVSNTFF